MTHKVLMVIAPDQFRDEELLTPRNAFQAQGWQVDTASTQAGEAKGMLGAVENVTQTLSDIESPALSGAYDAIVVVGGMGSPEYLWNNAQLHTILKSIAQQKKVVAAICLSGAVLANAGLLNGKQATVWEMPESLEVFKQHGAIYTGKPVTVDGYLVTANGPEAADDFAKAVIERVGALISA